MSSPFRHLFSPVHIGKVEIKNRIAMVSMGVYSPRLTRPDGSYSREGADYYIARAKGGVGLIFTGLITITDMGPGEPFPMTNLASYTENQKYLADGIHEHGAKIFVQLTALSGRSAEGLHEPAPSALPNFWDPTKQNPEMTRAEIKEYIHNFAETAYASQLAGFDGVEIHAVHEGYLLDQFTIKATNRRQDEYGGSLENRLRFPCEVIRAIKDRCGADFPVSLRYSVKSYMKGFNRGALPGEEFVEFGRDYEESRQAARMFQEAGCDLLNCDNGSYDAWYWSHPPTYMPKACNLADAAFIKKAVDIPVACAGKFDDPELADQAISEGRIDLMGLGRPLLADPDIANKFLEGRLEDIRPCICCHQGCLSRIFLLEDISCAVNPACGREASYALGPAKVKKKVLVVGGGLGGMEAARVSALKGHTVELFEKTGTLGGVFVSASAPDFKDDDKRLLAWYRKQIADLGITVNLGVEVGVGQVEKGLYDEIFVATGAVERRLSLPGLNDDNSTYAIEAFQKGDLPGQNMVVIGGGLTGCEIAYDLARRGKAVTILEMTDTILNVPGLSAANYNMLVELLEYHQVAVMTAARLKGFKDGRAEVVKTIKNFPNVAGRAKLSCAVGPEGRDVTLYLPADHFVVSIGYLPNNDLYRRLASEKKVHLIGDAHAPANVMNAIWQAYEAAKDI